MRNALAPLALALGLTLAGAVPAQDAPAKAGRLQALQKELADAETAFREAWASLPNPRQEDPRVEKLYQAFAAKQHAAFAGALDIAKTDPKADAGLEALEWLLTNPQAYSDPAARSALELTAQHHAANHRIGGILAVLSYYPQCEGEPSHDEAVALLRVVVEKNPDRALRGLATLGLACLVKQELRLAESRGRRDVDRLTAEAIKAFEALLRDYGGCEDLRGEGDRPTKLGDDARAELFELRHLGIGQSAPDIEGEDLAGARFKLSDYRGKVVLLVFWASWCGPCMAAVPHEKELVEHFKGRPFALVGVNGDPDKDRVLKVVARQEIPWRSFWNGEDGPGGSIATAWNIRGWPTVYVIDPKGVIRYKYLRGKRLDEPLEQLVTEAEAKEGRR
jgi:thiol-disulfide isomerase/thioredoxin